MRLEILPWLSVVPRAVPILKDGVHLGLINQYAPNLSSPTPLDREVWSGLLLQAFWYGKYVKGR